MSSSFMIATEFDAVAGHCAVEKKNSSPLSLDHFCTNQLLFSQSNQSKTACDVKQMTPIFSRAKTEF